MAVYPAFYCLLGIGVAFRFAVWYKRINKSKFIKENIEETIFMFAIFKCRKSSTQTYKLLTIKLLYSMIL